MKSKKCCTSSGAHSNEFKNVVTTRSSGCAPPRTRRARSITHARLACHGNTTHTKCLPCAPFGHVHVTKRPCSKAQHLIPKCILRAHKPASRRPSPHHARSANARSAHARSAHARSALARSALARSAHARSAHARSSHARSRLPTALGPHSLRSLHLEDERQRTSANRRRTRRQPPQQRRLRRARRQRTRRRRI